MDAATVAAIGGLPNGRGVLGALIDDPQPVRLSRISADSRSAGLPQAHPDMTTFLGMPIRSHNSVFGNLYLTERLDGEFTAEDEEIVRHARARRLDAALTGGGLGRSPAA